MRSQVPPVCAHCQSTKSPLWRRGTNQEVLCNACGLYWKHHGAYRPLALKSITDKKGVEEGGFHQDQLSRITEFQTKSNINSLAYTTPSTIRCFNPTTNANSQRKTGPMRTGNILMMPGQYGFTPYRSGLSNGNNNNSNKNNKNTTTTNNTANMSNALRPSTEHVLPPLNIKPRDLSQPNPLAGQRQLTAAPVLPNLKSLINNLINNENENISEASSNAAVTATTETVSVNQTDSMKPIKSSAPSPATTAPAHTATFSFNQQPPIQPKPPANSLTSPLKFIIIKGVSMYQGDHVSIRGDDSNIYFAILTDFWMTENGRRFCNLRWLIPKISSAPTSALQERFELGPAHGKVEPMEAVLDVFYSPYRDQLSSESIRKRYLYIATSHTPPHTNSSSSASAINNIYERSNNYNTRTKTVSIVPPPHVIHTIRAISEKHQQDHSFRNQSHQSENSALHFALPPISIPTLIPNLIPSESDSSDVPMNAIENSDENAAKMLLSMI